jgi:hypothetical protein
MIAKGAEALRQCEARLRELMAEASAAGQYESVANLMAWAKAVAEIVDGYQSSQSEVSSRPTKTSTRSEESAFRPQAPASKRAARKGTRQTYPRFKRYRDELVKIGWSKKEKKEYQHRAPWSVVEILCRRANEWQGKDFVSDDLFPLAAVDGTEIPSYQAYLSLAWLKHEELVLQNGRQGYHVPQGTDLLSAADERWNALPSGR